MQVRLLSTRSSDSRLCIHSRWGDESNVIKRKNGMTLRIVPYTAEHEEGVRAFNARLAAKNLDPSLYSTWFPTSHVSQWLPNRAGCELYQEYFVAVDDDSSVRGGYILKHQPFLVQGSLLHIADYQLPISEGIIDRRFVSLGVQLYADAIRRQPYLFGLGGGEYHTPLLRFFMAAGWQTVPTPFWFRIVHPSVALRNLTVLRTSPVRRAALDILSSTGLGWAGIKTLQTIRRSHRSSTGVTFQKVPEFGDWADAIWNDAKDSYSFIAVRDRLNLNMLYPAAKSRFIRLKIMRDGQVIGWAVLLNTQMSDNKYFNNMRVGTLVDCLAKPDDAADVVGCARDVLEEADVDLIVSNQGSRAWGQALKSCGFIEGPSNLPFFASPALAPRLEPFAANAETFHLTRGDGDGPIHL